jgi:uncharacterized protein YgbK (DUF1537 family)
MGAAGTASVAEPASTAAIRELVEGALRAAHATLAVLDDDPTGSQTVADVPLLLRFDDDDLDWALTCDAGLLFALTNARALAEPDAVALTRALAARLAAAARRHGRSLRVVSRSDSTLRGHFPAETDAIAEGLRDAGAASFDAVLLCPAFPEAGRVTVDGVHCVRRDDGALVPVAATEFAHDPVFGYAESDLRDWVAARTGAPREAVGHVALADVRDGGPARVAELLGRARDGQVVVLDAAAREDLDVLALGVAEAEAAGRRFLIRSGPSFVAARAGRALPPPLDPGAIAPPEGHGLLVVGSHIALTTRQLRRAAERHALKPIELDVAAVGGPDSGRAEREVERAAHALTAALARGDAALATSRTLAADAGVAAKARIAAAVVAVVERTVARARPAFVVAKGGITSHDLAQKALGAGRATVLGQLFPGKVSVWRLEDGPHVGLPYVVFPGNVGDEHALAEALGRLKGDPA